MSPRRDKQRLCGSPKDSGGCGGQHRRGTLFRSLSYLLATPSNFIAFPVWDRSLFIALALTPFRFRLRFLHIDLSAFRHGSALFLD